MRRGGLKLTVYFCQNFIFFYFYKTTLLRDDRMERMSKLFTSNCPPTHTANPKLGLLAVLLVHLDDFSKLHF